MPFYDRIKSKLFYKTCIWEVTSIDPTDFQNLTSDLLAIIKLFMGNAAIFIYLMKKFLWENLVTPL